MIKLLFLSALCQLIGFASGTLIGDPIASPLIHGFVALIVARSFKLPGSWQFINLIMPTTLLIPLNSSLIPLSILCLLLLTYLPTLWTKVPYYPTNHEVIKILKSRLPDDTSFSFADFGSGFGGVLFDLAPNFPKANFVGYELGIIPYLFSKLRSIAFPNVKIHFKSFWKPDWRNFDYLYAFLSPQPMGQITAHYGKLEDKRPVFFVNSFPLHTKEIEALKAQSQIIYVYR